MFAATLGAGGLVLSSFVACAMTLPWMLWWTKGDAIVSAWGLKRREKSPPKE